MLVTPIQQLLKQAVRAGACATGSCLNAPVEIHVAADKMNGGLLPSVADCIRPSVDFFGPRSLKAPIVEQLEQGQEPALTGNAGPGICERQFLAGCLKVSPRGLQPVPRPIGGFANLLSWSQVIRGFIQTPEASVA